MPRSRSNRGAYFSRPCLAPSRGDQEKSGVERNTQALYINSIAPMGDGTERLEETL
jgi:hypothetical protein